MKITICLLLVLSMGIMFSACVSVQDELFLQNIEIQGSPSQPPIHITAGDMQEKSVFASPHLSVSSGTMTTSLERQYKGSIPAALADFQPQGLSWELPRVTFGLDLDYAATNSLALSGGVSASVGNGRQFTSFYGGLGLYSASPTTSLRLDVGVQYVDIQYRGATVILRTVSGGPQDTVYYLDQGKEFQFNLYASLTLNSTNQDNFLNWFVQIGISPQTLTSFVPSRNASTGPGPYVASDQRAESSVFWLSATPGVYFTLAENRRLLLGVRLMRELLSESSKPGLIVIPMLQLDWSL